MTTRKERITGWWLARERHKKMNTVRRSDNSLISKPPNASGDVEVEAISGPMSGKKVSVSKFPADAAYFKT